MFFFLFSSKMIKREERRGAAPESGMAGNYLRLCIAVVGLAIFFKAAH